MNYLSRYSPEQARRHEVKPGITGWAQVNGRNSISWEEKFKLDVEYVNRISFGLDCKILWMTLLKVVQRKGISAEGHVTMEEFRGMIAELSTRLDKLENVESVSDEKDDEEEEDDKMNYSKIKELEEKIENLSKIAGAPSITKKSDREIEAEKREILYMEKIRAFKKK
jgi:hypothetical protein